MSHELYHTPLLFTVVPPPTVGEYLLYIKYNNENIPDSPFKVHVTPAGGDGHGLTLRELQDQGCLVSTPSPPPRNLINTPPTPF